MKLFLFKSILFSFILCSFLIATYFLIKARSDTKTTNDPEPNKLYVDSNDTLTAAKWNSLVDNTFTKKTTTIKCISQWTATSTTQLSKTWDSASCYWISKLPKDYNHCTWGITYINSTHTQNFAYCDTESWILKVANGDAYRLTCNFLCWDD